MSNEHFVERKSCPVCGSEQSRRLFACAYTEDPIKRWMEARYAQQGTVDFDLLAGADFVLLECPSCSLIYQQWIADEFLSQIVYERWSDPDRALEHREKRVVRVRGRYALEIMSILDFMGRSPANNRFLDFGMGWGHWVEMASSFGVDTYGLEPAATRAERASNHGVHVIELDELAGLRFDFINTEQVFEHLPAPAETIGQLAGSLNDGGILKISVPNAMRVKRRLRAGDWTAAYGSRHSMNDVFPLIHINAFNHQALVRLGRTVGLEPVRIPPRLRYRYAPMWERLNSLAKRTVGAHYRALRKQETVIWFRRSR